MNKRYRLKTLVLFVTLMGGALWIGPQARSQSLETKLVQILKKQPNNLKARQALAKVYFDQKAYKKTISILELYIYEINEGGLALLQKSYHQTKDVKNEIRTLEQLTLKKPQNFNWHLRLSKKLIDSQEDQKAIIKLRETIKINPKKEEPYILLLSLFKKIRNNYETRIVLTDMIKHLNPKPIYYTELCRIDTEDGFLEKSENTCKKAIRLSPKESENYVHLGIIYRDKGDLEKSKKFLIKSARKFKNSPLVQKTTGDLFFKEKNFLVASQYYQDASLLDPKSQENNLALALTLFELQKYGDALKSFTKACQISTSMLHEFRSALSKLELQGNSDWARKYRLKIQLCKR